MTISYPSRDGSRVLTVTVLLDRVRDGLRLQLSPADERARSIVWTDGDSEMVVHLSELDVALRRGSVTIRIIVETDQTGRTNLTLRFDVGSSIQDASLQATTPAVPAGDPLLAARWGQIAQKACWNALLLVGQQALANRRESAEMTIVGLCADSKGVHYVAQETGTKIGV
jgi:hypothetical protein